MNNDRYFTFGQDHMTNYPLNGRLADYWVRVSLPDGRTDHRDLFIKLFTTHHCPRPMQFATDYGPKQFNPDYFPNGELCLITEEGIENAP